MDEDAVLFAIGEFRADIRNMGREIGQLREALEKKEEKRDACCKECRDEIDRELDAQALLLTDKIDKQAGRLDTVEKQHQGEQAVKAEEIRSQSLWDSKYVRGGTILGVIIALAGLSLQILGVI